MQNVLVFRKIIFCIQWNFVWVELYSLKLYQFKIITGRWLRFFAQVKILEKKSYENLLVYFFENIIFKTKKNLWSQGSFKIRVIRRARRKLRKFIKLSESKLFRKLLWFTLGMDMKEAIQEFTNLYKMKYLMYIQIGII